MSIKHRRMTTAQLTNLFSTDDVEFDENTRCDKCGGKRFRYFSLLIDWDCNKITFHCIDCDENFSIFADLEVKEKVITLTRKVLVVTEKVMRSTV